MSCYTQIHTSAQKLFEDIDISNTILTIHVLGGYDVSSTVGTKAATLKANYHLLARSRQNRRPNFLALKLCGHILR